MATRQLRGVAPTAVEKRLKALFYGPPSGGKTMAAIQFPRPYLIDAERGAENRQYTEALTKAGGVVFQSNDFADVFDEVQLLHTTRHEFKTLIIDPITTIFDDLLDACEKRVGDAHGRHYGEAKKHWKRLGLLLMRLDMNVIITSHQKALYNKDHDLLGNTFDGPKGLDYLFDLVFEVSRPDGERVGRVVKTRVDGFPDGELIKFSYPEIAARYGRKVLERDAVPVATIGEGELLQIMSALAVRGDGDAVEAKMLARMSIASLAEMTTEQASTWLAWLNKSKVTAGGAGHAVSPSAVKGDAVQDSDASPSSVSPATSSSPESPAVPAAFVESSIAAGVHKALEKAPKKTRTRTAATAPEVAIEQDAAHTASMKALWAISGELGISKKGDRANGVPSKILITSDAIAAAVRLSGCKPENSIVNPNSPPFVAPRYLTTEQIQYLTHHLRELRDRTDAGELVGAQATTNQEGE